MISRKPLNVFALAVAEHFHELPFLPLGMVLAYLKVWDNGRLRQCCTLEPMRIACLDQGPVEGLVEEIAAQPRPVCLLSSYVWNHHLNLSVAKQLKRANERAIVIIGGPEVPKYEGETEEFLRQNPCVDVAVLGEGEVSCAEVLYAIRRSWDK